MLENKKETEDSAKRGILFLYLITGQRHDIMNVKAYAGLWTGRICHGQMRENKIQNRSYI